MILKGSFCTSDGLLPVTSGHFPHVNALLVQTIIGPTVFPAIRALYSAVAQLMPAVAFAPPPLRAMVPPLQDGFRSGNHRTEGGACALTKQVT